MDTPTTDPVPPGGRFVVGIAGPSGAGKSTLAQALAEAVAGRALVLCCDRYYRDLSHLFPHERARQNFDHPDAVEHDLLAAHLAGLKRGRTVADAPCYSFETHTRLATVERIAPKPAIIVEGLHVLHWPEVAAQLDLKVFVSAPHEVCLARRLARDVRERGRTEEFCRQQYERTVRPMAEQFVIPSSRRADVVVDGEEPVATAVARILAHAPGARLSNARV